MEAGRMKWTGNVTLMGRSINACRLIIHLYTNKILLNFILLKTTH